ncbi:MAG: glycine--tRNA ligase subunit beta [Deltaproteobacteria bacterium]|nr:glycine--tRNA ligase subunit beta [Deltaproteobacteria bacterium]
MAKDLILEIGTEEIPAAFVPRALGLLEGFLRKSLAGARLGFGEIRTLGTPRRLAAIVTGLAERQEDSREEVKGPSAKAAFDGNGRPTGALLGFARSQNVDVSEIKTVKTGKGEYVYAVRETKGSETAAILPGLLKEAVSQDMFPKSMRWGGHDITFARPVHWILSLFGGSPVEFTWGHIKSSNITYGHRFLGNGPIAVDGVDAYLEKLRKAFVITDPEERKRIIREGLAKEAGAAGGRLLPDEGLVDEVTYLVEYPVVVRGSFPEEFLEIPRDCVVNAMREHQRYFSVESADGRLLPYFLTVANTRATDMDMVRKGNERVLRARLNDAKFHFEQDTKRRLVDRVEDLKGVVFQAKLGTSFEKVERFTELALHIGFTIGFSRQKDEGEKAADYLSEDFNPAAFDPAAADPGLYSKLVVGRAAVLAKADLTTGMVGEFPNLQGAMGSVYARRSGEADAVAAAIYEHYLPSVSGGVLPASVPGAVVSMADKLDTIAGCFGVGLIPTGAQDPYALRRQALGVIAIILDKDFRVRLDELVEKEVEILGNKILKAYTPEGVKKDVLDFFRDRLRHSLLGQGLSFDSVDAVLSAPWFDIVDAVKRVRALEGFKKHPACESLSAAFKRVSNILKGAEVAGAPGPALFTEPEEKKLFEVRNKLAPVIEGYAASGDYEKAFEELASIKEQIDAFFDKVLVMAKDPSVRQNRLALLNSVRDLYFRMADLSKLSV